MTTFFATTGKAQSLEAKKTNTISRIGFWEYLPDTYSNDRNLPVIIFLHGRGERGDGSEAGLQNVLTWGPLRQVKNDKLENVRYQGKDYKFIILAPQLNKPNSFWSPELVDEFINYALYNYNIDRKRIYLTGLSMGGNGTWSYAYSSYNNPNKLAAIAPIAGWGNEDKACEIKKRNIPVWAFHGEDDQTVLFEKGKSMFKAVEACSGGKSSAYKFTSYPDVGHNSWEKAYFASNKWHSPNIYEWFLSHSLESAPDEVYETNVIYDEKKKENQVQLKVLAELATSISESSGLIVDNNGHIWSHNDSGHGPYLMRIDTNGTVPEFKKIIFASNLDWEDLTKDKNGNVYIGDIGNNENNRRKLIIYKIALQDSSKRVKAEAINYTYADQTAFPPSLDKMNYDSEALVYYNDSLYIFTKNRTQPYNGLVKVYRVPSVPGDYVAELVDSLQLSSGPMLDNWITGADISPNGSNLVLLSHRKLWIISCFDKKFSEGKVTELLLDSFTQKEGVTFANDSVLYVSDERFKKVLGGYLYELNLNAWLSENCD